MKALAKPLRGLAYALLIFACTFLVGLFGTRVVLADQVTEGSPSELAPEEPSAAGQDDLAKNGTLVVTCVITNSWEGDDRAFEYWFEVGDCERYGELTLTLAKADGTTVTYTLDPDSDELEDVDILTNKDVEPHESSAEKNVFYAFTLKNGETATITGIPEQAHFQCYVASDGAGGHGTGYNAQYENFYSSTIGGGTSGNFSGGRTYRLTGTHRRYLRVVPVVKILLNGSGQAAEFPFRLTLVEEDGETPITNYKVGTGVDGSDIVTDGSGVAEFAVSAGGNVTLFVPAHANYKIEEVQGESERYRLFETPAEASGYVDIINTVPCLFFNVEKYPITFEKQDDESFLIPGATLQVLDDQGTVVKEWVTEEGVATEVWLDITTGDTYHGIPRSYVLHEVDAPEGYKPAEDIGFTVVYSDDDGAARVVLEDGTSTDKIVLVDEDMTRDVGVTKAWDDADDQDGIRPNEVRVQLLANGEPLGDPVALSSGNQWSHTWAGLDWHAGGKEVSYSVEELDVAEGYAAVVSGDVANGFVVTNAHEPKPAEKPDAPKDDKGDKEKDRPTKPETPSATRAPEVPQTGDKPSWPMAAAALLGSCLMLAGMVLKRERG